MEGTKEAVMYALDHKKDYKEIVFDPYRGIEAPYVVSIPYMYLLFYSKYDPSTYHLSVMGKNYLVGISIQLEKYIGQKTE